MASLIGVPSGTRNFTSSLKKGKMIWKKERSFTREYCILADHLDESSDSIMSLVPRLGSIADGCVCKKVQVKENETVEHPKTGKLTVLVRVTCDFDSDAKLDPTEFPPTIKFGANTAEIVMIRDAKGKMIETVNHERLNCTRPHVMPTLEISRYERYPWNPNVNFTHANHLNSLPFWGAPPKHALLRPITCEYVQLEVIDGQKEWFCKTSYKIDFDFKADSEEPWKLKVLHYGNYVRESLSNSNIIQAVDVQGRPRSCRARVRADEQTGTREPKDFHERPAPRGSQDQPEKPDVQPDRFASLRQTAGKLCTH